MEQKDKLKSGRLSENEIKEINDLLKNRDPIDVEYAFATTFGVISPKINKNTVVQPVAIAIALELFPKIEIAIIVAIEEASILTILLPSNIADNISFGFFNQAFNRSAFFGFSSST